MNIQLTAEDWRLIVAALEAAAEECGAARCSALAARLAVELDGPKPADGGAYEAQYLHKFLATRHA